ncbi:MAG: hypothetical protein LLG02_15255 [Pelosinus sp.]|nr:hypothetical protein [Pelosinus sp.]
MFSDQFDTVRTSIKYNNVDALSNNATQAEISLFYIMIMGYHPTLTQTQIIDSNIIIRIAQSKYKEHFLKLIKNGNIRISLSPKSDSVQDHFIKSMQIGLDDDSQFYDFSSIPFLSDYNNKTRKLIQRKIIEAFSKGCFNFKNDDILPEHAEYLSDIVRFILEINIASSSSYIKGGNYTISLDGALGEIISRLQKNCEDKDLVSLMNELKLATFSNQRSLYYNFLNEAEKRHDKVTIEKVRKLVNYCYNIAIATSVNDPEGARINIPSEVDSEILSSLVSNSKIEENKISFNNSNDYLTWESVSHILQELESIQKEKKCDREEAIKIFKVRQSRTPIRLIGKYIGISALTLPFNFLPLGDSIPDFIIGAFSDTIGEKLKKPSIAEMISAAKSGPHKSRVASNALEYMSINF